MFGDYFFILSGSISAGSTAALLHWLKCHPDEKPPLILMTGPIAAGLLAILEGVFRVALAG